MKRDIGVRIGDIGLDGDVGRIEELLLLFNKEIDDGLLVDFSWSIVDGSIDLLLGSLKTKLSIEDINDLHRRVIAPRNFEGEKLVWLLIEHIDEELIKSRSLKTIFKERKPTVALVEVFLGVSDVINEEVINGPDNAFYERNWSSPNGASGNGRSHSDENFNGFLVDDEVLTDLAEELGLGHWRLGLSHSFG